MPLVFLFSHFAHQINNSFKFLYITTEEENSKTWDLASLVFNAVQFLTLWTVGSVHIGCVNQKIVLMIVKLQFIIENHLPYHKTPACRSLV